MYLLAFFTHLVSDYDDLQDQWARKPRPRMIIKKRRYPSSVQNALLLVDLMDNMFRPTLVEIIDVEKDQAAAQKKNQNTRKLAKAITRTRSPQEAHRVIELAHKMGSPLKQNVYEGVSHQLAEAKHWHLIPSLVVIGINNTGRTTVRLLDWRIRAYVEMNHHTSLDQVFEEFEQQNLKHNRRTFHLLISGHVHNRNLVKAKACLH
jgi:hypothetical protein